VVGTTFGRKEISLPPDFPQVACSAVREEFGSHRCSALTQSYPNYQER
jgi:hypothetical protein